MKIEIETESADNVVDLLLYVARLANIGHSFPVVVDPEDGEYRQSYDVDGDGPTRIIAIKVDGREVYRIGAGRRKFP